MLCENCLIISYSELAGDGHDDMSREVHHLDFEMDFS